MIHGIGHIGIAVKNIDQALEQLCKGLGMEKPVVKEVTERHMKVAVVKLGPVDLELLEETAPNGFLSGPVSEKGDFIHHVCLVSDDIDTDIQGLEEKGITMSQETARKGLRGKRVSFVASGLLGDVPVEISEL